MTAILFDAYGTLFDVYSVAELAEQLRPGKGPPWLHCCVKSKSTTPACEP
jgi:FMN phosphatase YigB (HAD superfamily)